MKNKILTFVLTTAASLFLLTISSCSGILSPSEPDAPQASNGQAFHEQRLSLRGTFRLAETTAAPSQLNSSSASRNAVPDTSSLAYSVLAVNASNGNQVWASEVTSSSYAFNESLTVGTWQITAYAKTSGGTLVMQSETKTITLSSTIPDATTSLTLGPETSGSGNVSLTINWESNSGIGYCKYSCGSIPDLTGESEDSATSVSIATSSPIPSGIYELTLEFYTSETNFTLGAKPLYKCTEYLAVYPGLMTNQWTSQTAPHLTDSGSFNVTLDCVHSFIYRKIYVSSSGDDTTANGTSERPFGSIEKAMKRLNEVAGANIITGISETNPWELHVSGEVKKTTSMTTAISFINVDNITGHLAIIGDGSGAALNADNKGRVLFVGTGATVTMQNITLKNGTTSGGAGAGIYVDTSGTFKMISGELSGCTSSASAGGIFNKGTLSIEGGMISGNSATNQGGGIFADSGSLTISGGTISGNSTSSYGGGIYVNTGSVTITGGTVRSNTASDGANNVFISTSISATIPAGNDSFYNEYSTANGKADAVCLSGSNFVRFNQPNDSGNSLSSFSNLFSGSATIYLGTTDESGKTWKSDSLKLTQGCQQSITIMPTNPSTSVKATIKNSSSTESSDYLIHFNKAEKTLTLTRLILDGNSKKCGIVKLDAGTLNATNCTFQYGKARDGGGLYVNNSTTATLTSCTVQYCNAEKENGTTTAYGGGIYTRGVVTFSGTIQNCSTKGVGGGAVVEAASGASFTMTDGTITSCNAESTGSSGGDGGGVYTYWTFSMEGGTITGCTSDRDGAGVYLASASSIPVLEMKGNAKVTSDNEVYLGKIAYPSENIGKIKITGNLTSPQAAKIKPYSYTGIPITTVLTDNSGGSTVSANYTKFRLVDSDNYMIDDEGCISTGILVSTNEELSNAITRIKNLSNGESLIITLANNVNTTTTADDDYFIKVPSGANVVIKASSTTTLNYSSSSSSRELFYVGSSASLTLTNINLTGRTHWGAGYVYGTLTINSGTKINNTSASGIGSCITVLNGGKLVMNGGEIKNNLWLSEGLIEIRSGGTFEMNGGEISSNNYYYASTYLSTVGRYTVAGVYVCGGGTFTMTGGTISSSVFNDNATYGVPDGSSVENHCYNIYAASGSTYTKTGGTVTNVRNDS